MDYDPADPESCRAESHRRGHDVECLRRGIRLAVSLVEHGLDGEAVAATLRDVLSPRVPTQKDLDWAQAVIAETEATEKE